MCAIGQRCCLVASLAAGLVETGGALKSSQWLYQIRGGQWMATGGLRLAPGQCGSIYNIPPLRNPEIVVLLPYLTLR